MLQRAHQTFVSMVQTKTLTKTAFGNAMNGKTVTLSQSGSSESSVVLIIDQSPIQDLLMLGIF